MEDKVLEIINTVLDNRAKQQIKAISPELNLRKDIGFDSLDLAELTVRLEAEYDIDVFQDGMVSTVGEVLNRLNGK